MKLGQRHIIFIGSPGSGKGTQAQQLAANSGYLHLSTGELFRKKYAGQNKETAAGKASIDKGGFFSDQIAYQILQDFLRENATAKGILYDGFPRDITQAKYFVENICETPMVIELKANEDELVKRLLLRGKTSHREDDKSEEIIRHRMLLYHKLTAPVLAFFKDKNLVHTILADESVEQIAMKITQLLTEK